MTTALAIVGPRPEPGRRLLVAGWMERYSVRECDAARQSQWQRFVRHQRGGIPGRVGRFAYGISIACDEAGHVDYLCGVEVTDFSSLPRNCGRLCLSARRYLVFQHAEHISSLSRTWQYVASHWCTEMAPTEMRHPPGATSFERYDESFNVSTGMGGVEIWIPLTADTSRTARSPLPAQATAPGLGRVSHALTGRRR